AHLSRLAVDQRQAFAFPITRCCAIPRSCFLVPAPPADTPASYALAHNMSAKGAGLRSPARQRWVARRINTSPPAATLTEYIARIKFHLVLSQQAQVFIFKGHLFMMFLLLPNI